MDSPEGWCIDAHLAIPPLEKRGWSVETIPWRRPDVSWDRYDAVYLGTAWDYPQDVTRFLDVLERIGRCGTVLVNELALVRWNLSKTYLPELARRGAPVVPTLCFDDGKDGPDEWFAHFGTDRLIVKPSVSTNATDTFLLERPLRKRPEQKLRETFTGRPGIVQPFIGNVRTDGEYSLVFFAARFSHAIRKIPQAGDFRVQEEYGANITALQPDPELLNVAEHVLALAEPAPVYGRCDFVRDDSGRWLLMELEVIEPSLYLRMDPAAAERFAEAFDAREREHRR